MSRANCNRQYNLRMFTAVLLASFLGYGADPVCADQSSSVSIIEKLKNELQCSDPRNDLESPADAPSSPPPSSHMLYGDIVPSSGAVTEFFEILAEFAVDRARTKGLHLLEKKLSGEVCSATLPLNGKKMRLEQTCNFLQTTPIDLVLSYPERLRHALTADLLALTHATVETLAVQLDRLDRSALARLLLMAEEIAVCLAQDSAGRSDRDQLALLLTSLEVHLKHQWCSVSEAEVGPILAALVAARLYMEGATDPSRVSLRFLVASALETLEIDTKTSQRVVVRALHWARVAAQAWQQVRETKATSPTADRDHVVAVLRMVFEIVRTSSGIDEEKKRTLAAAELLMLAALSSDPTKLVEAIADYLMRPGEGENAPEHWKAGILLKTVTAYARTLRLPAPKDSDKQTADYTKWIHDERKRILGELVDATTDRQNRYSDRVVSVGMNLGMLAVGRQGPLTSGSNRDQERIYGQLILPVGVAFQQLPPRSTPWWRPNGVHGMLTLLDLGQYVAWSNDEGTTPVRWDTAFSLGGQIAATFGSPDNLLLIGIQGAVAPTLFADNSDVHTAASGVWRAGVFITYYIPLFDLN